MHALTKRQQQILDFIQQFSADAGFPPTAAEIAEAMQVRSVNGIRDHLQALARKGAIELIPNASRGIRVLSDNASSGLPIVGRVAAGSPILAHEHIESHLPVAAELFHHKADYLLRVTGMSMRDAGILDGDLLAVRQTQDVHNGQIVVARIGDEVTVKRLQLRDQKALLEPANPDFETLVVDLSEQAFNIEGVVVGVIRRDL